MYRNYMKQSHFSHVNKLVHTTPELWFTNEKLGKLDGGYSMQNEENNISKSIILSEIMNSVTNVFKYLNETQRITFENFINTLSKEFNKMLSHIEKYDYWEFTPIELFLWVALANACKTEAGIIEHILNHPSFNNKLLKKKGPYDMTILHFSCINKDLNALKKILELEEFTKNDLLSTDKNKYNCIDYLSVFNLNGLKHIIENNLIKKEDFWKNNFDSLYYAIILSSESSSYIINSEFMCDKPEEKMYENYTLLMLASCYDPKATETILKKDWCTKEYFSIANESKCSALHLASAKNTDCACLLLDCEYMTKELFEQEFKTMFNSKTNLLYMSTINDTLLGKILEHKYMTKEYLNRKIGSNNIIYNTFRNIKSLKKICSSKYFNIEMLFGTENYFLQICKNNKCAEIVNIILENDNFNEILFSQIYALHNCLTISCSIDNNENIVKLLLNSKYINHAVLTHEYHGRTAIQHVIDKYPGLTNYIINNIILHNDILSNDILKTFNKKINMPIYFYLLLNSDFNDFKKLLALPYNTENIMNYINSSDLSIIDLLYMANKEDHIRYFIQSKYATKFLCERVDKDGNNIFMNYIENNEYDDIKENVDLILNSNVCTTNALHQINNKDETLLSLAIKTNLEFAKKIMSCDKFDMTKENIGRLLYFSIDNNNLESVQYILNINNFKQEYLEYIDPLNNNNIFHCASIVSSDIFILICRNKYFKKEYLTMKNKYNNNVLIEACTTEIYKEIIDFLENNDLINSELITGLINAEDETFMDIVHDEYLMNRFLNTNKYDTNYITNIQNRILNINNDDNAYSIEETCILLNKIVRLDNYDYKSLFDNVNGYYIIHKYILKKYSSVTLFLIKTYLCREMLSLINDIYGNILTMSYLIDGLTEIIMNYTELNYNDIIVKCSRGYNILHNICDKESNIDINIIINNKLCTENFLKLKTNLGFNALSLAIENNRIDSIIKILNSKYCTEELISESCSANGKNLCMYMCSIEKYDTCLAVLNSNMGSTKMLLEKDKNNDNLLIYSLSDESGKTTCKLLEHHLCTNEVVNQKVGINNITLLHHSILHYNVFLNLINSKYDLSECFNNNENIYTMACITDYKVFEKLLKSKYFKIQDLYKNDNNTILTCINHINSFELLVNNNGIWEKIKYYSDSDNISYLTFCSDNITCMKYLIAYDKITEDMLAMQDNYNCNVFHHCIKNNNACIDILLNLLENNKILLQQDKLGNSVFHYAAIYGNLHKLTNFIDSGAIELINNLGDKFFMTAIKNNKFTKDMLNMCSEHKNNNGETAFLLMTRYNNTYVKDFIKSNNFNKTVIKERDYYGNSPIYFSCRYTNSLKYYLDLCDENDLYNSHSDYGSALITASKYSPDIVKLILEWSKTTDKLLSCTENKLNFIQVASINNPNSLKIILESKLDLTKYMNEYYSEKYSDYYYHPFILACKYEPECVKHFLESKYCSEKLLYKNVDGKIAIQYALECQPKALMYIVNSKYGTHNMLSHTYQKTGYTILNRIKLGNIGINNFKDVQNKLNIVNYKNEICEENPCSICYTYKPIICLAPCMHTVCVSCALLIKKCSVCKKTISNKAVIYL